MDDNELKVAVEASLQEVADRFGVELDFGCGCCGGGIYRVAGVERPTDLDFYPRLSPQNDGGDKPVG
jgi:hypothetical protein